MSCFLVYFLWINWALWVNVLFENTEAESIQKLKNDVNELRMDQLYQSGLIISFIVCINLLFQKLVLSKLNYTEVLKYALVNLLLVGITISKGSQRTYSDLENIIQNNFIVNKTRLANNFVDMRSIPSYLVSVKKIGDFEIGYQEEKHRTERFNYPDNYAIGVLNKEKDDYKYVVYVKGISPIDEYPYIKQIIDSFETDSSYIKVLLKERSSIRANIYRQEKKENEFMMWKWVHTHYGGTDFKIEELINEHLFES